jgi:hypothetical protein
MSGIKHSFTSTKDQGSDATLVSKNEWNNDHLLGTSALGDGTSFPVSPTSGDLYYRTDRHLLYFHDGTRWLTTTLYEHFLCGFNNVSATASFYTAVWEEDFDVYVEKIYSTMYAASALSGTAYWTLDFYFWDGATQGSTKATHSLQSGTNATFTRKASTINSLLGTSVDAIGTTLTKVSTPGVFYGGSIMTYRLVG